MKILKLLSIFTACYCLSTVVFAQTSAGVSSSYTFQLSNSLFSTSTTTYSLNFIQPGSDMYQTGVCNSTPIPNTGGSITVPAGGTLNCTVTTYEPSFLPPLPVTVKWSSPNPANSTSCTASSDVRVIAASNVQAPNTTVNYGSVDLSDNGLLNGLDGAQFSVNPGGVSTHCND